MEKIDELLFALVSELDTIENLDGSSYTMDI